ncbi:hypothetical protein HPP92_022816 [Vanilla planifolia]|uniref:C2H2-type domain-containing protein n=1 Tax=Vanilla planifolia TaxID=51239 RepID=A0A835PVF5_VANPL|nr:hypothetical protein HPP92_022816 [Vanilla planifolia]
MEFWGVEVKPGQTVKCEPGEDRLLHLSQAALGEVKKDKGTENVPIFVNINEQKLVIGTLSAENCTQIQYDVVFEKEFELSHGSDSEDDLQLDEKANGKTLDKSIQKKATTEKAVAGKDDTVAGKAKAKTGKPNKIDGSKTSFLEEDDEDDEDDDEDEDDAEDSDDDDEELPKVGMDSDDEIDEDDSSEDEEANLKKRSADGKLKSPIPVKKTKVQMPSGNKKAGGEVKKGGQTATTPKQAGKPAPGDKAKQQTPKSTGSIVCKSCNKSFNSENGLQDHTKAKHSGSK